MFRIVSQLKFCGVDITDEEMLEKTYSTFHASNITLQQQYRLRDFKKYSELISSLLMAEKNNELLIKNHQSRPTGLAAFPEAKATFSKIIDEDIIMVVAVDVAVDAVEVVFTTLHRITRSTRSIM